MRLPAAADEIANSAVTFVDMGHVDQRRGIAAELLRQSSDLPKTEAMVERPEPDVAQTEPLGKERTRHAIEPGVPRKPGREQFIARRLEDDRQRLDVGFDPAAHWKATSFSETGLKDSTDMSVMRSSPVTMAWIAKSLSMGKMRELTPPLS